jgi:hypothetical protein
MKASMLGLALSTVAFGASSIYLWSQLTDEREQAVTARAANENLNLRIAELEKRRSAFGERRMGGPDAFEGAGIAHAGPGPNPPDGPPPGEAPVFSMLGPDTKPPEMPEAMLKMMRANVRAQNKRMYFDLQSKLHLTDEQTSAMLDLLTDQHTQGFRDRRNRDPEQARISWEAEQLKRDAAINDLLGSAKAAEFADYQKTMPSRSELMMISQQLEGVETPLSDDQRSRLLTALIEERERIPTPTITEGKSQEEMAKSFSEWQSDYEKRVAEQARNILSSDQYGTYTEYAQWQREMREQFAIQGPGGPPLRALRGNSATFMADPAGGVAFAVTTDTVSTSPTETQPKSK